MVATVHAGVNFPPQSHHDLRNCVHVLRPEPLVRVHRHRVGEPPRLEGARGCRAPPRRRAPSVQRPRARRAMGPDPLSVTLYWPRDLRVGSWQGRGQSREARCQFQRGRNGVRRPIFDNVSGCRPLHFRTPVCDRRRIGARAYVGRRVHRTRTDRTNHQRQTRDTTRENIL